METQNNLLNEFTEPSFQYASAGQRFLNCIIDVIAFYIVMMILGVILGLAAFATTETGGRMSGGGIQLFFLFLYFAVIILYYSLLEGSNGKTLGKLITKTKVVTEAGEPISYGKAFIRTLIRFVPFEFLSGFSGTTMWHDQWTKTMLVKDK